MREILLDTNAFVFLAFRSRRVPQSVQAQLKRSRLYVSQVCAIELAIKNSIGRFPLPPEFEPSFAAGFSTLVEDMTAEILPISMTHVATLNRLPLHHRDPFDRLVISQAITEDMTLLSSDDAFSAYQDLEFLRI